MKHTITITTDDKTHRTTLNLGGKLYEFGACLFEVRREPVRDLDAEEESGGGYQILKPGPELELTLRGTIISE
ncbi:hypothetical protein [Mesorhizobium retamae]|uniref:Uncharacterized protein n=1 Tax=Mesorhizobium retamae TaxID=2912854 RepID=A0ABS9QI42_9HYPH|nr:hypothetical protein [Mesorhizobium sp. IRAMC:0171]MCG7507030.1 hypothetical protein [Mesorhizobium sp. IRAMC:0171]